MELLSTILTGLVAALHFYFLCLEMFLWEKPMGLKAFGLGPELAKKTAKLAANQGLYNGFLAVGLCWGLFEPNPQFASNLKIYFLGCVAVAGLYGAKTVGKKVLVIQALPALLALTFELVPRY